MSSSVEIQRLRERLSLKGAGAGVRVRGKENDGFRVGMPSLDERVGLLGLEAVHEIYASAGDVLCADGMALGMAMRASKGPFLWAFEGRRNGETGLPYGPGLQGWGLEPSQLLLIEASSATALLAVGEDALRSGAFGAVILSSWGEHPAFTLTASRRLNLAASEGGRPAFIARAGAQPRASAAQSRWKVSPTLSSAQPLSAGAPGLPAFKLELLRKQNGPVAGEWIMEWDGERRIFVTPQVSGRLVSVPADRSAIIRAA
ncbi:ImuA family protein [Brevundimonas pishanensis]|uniref:ImuA family protein n=1 Tax=Brevundimonas pishanensis TaxID=2896315 RepID=UPI001FA78E92|nr:hypothetical protein [Brevundimonas pishanensis]